MAFVQIEFDRAGAASIGSQSSIIHGVLPRPQASRQRSLLNGLPQSDIEPGSGWGERVLRRSKAEPPLQSTTQFLDATNLTSSEYVPTVVSHSPQGSLAPTAALA